MKYVFMFMFLILGQTVLGQQRDLSIYEKDEKAITVQASDAYKYLGRIIVVHDSIYNGKIYQDSIAVCQIGKKVSSHSLTMIYINNARQRLDERFLQTFQLNKIWLKGIVVGTVDEPLVILYGSRNLSMDTRAK